MTNATKEQLADVIQAVRKIDNNHKRMKDETIVKMLLNDKIRLSILKHLNEQFPEICMAAVRQNCYALQFVKEQTLEIYMIAAQQDGWALQYVKDPALREEIKHGETKRRVNEWGRKSLP
jgi:hypothetical protein